MTHNNCQLQLQKKRNLCDIHVIQRHRSRTNGDLFPKQKVPWHKFVQGSREVLPQEYFDFNSLRVSELFWKILLIS